MIDKPATGLEGATPIRAGDVITQDKGHKGWSVIKVLLIDEMAGYGPTFHCLTYDSSTVLPTMDSVRQLPVRIYHAPVAGTAFARGWTVLGNEAASQEELVGFIEYLKLTDFPRYLAFTGQDSKELVGRANALYREACRLGDEGRRVDAIRIYDEVIDIFPLFFEAIDNRAFTFMELGDYQTALSGFEDSLRINPDGTAAFFSRAECLLRLGRFEMARDLFSEGIGRFPEQQEMFRKFRDIAQQALGSK